MPTAVGEISDRDVAALLHAHSKKRGGDSPDPLPMASGSARFRQAILAARKLHPDLLSQSQKLRLYALFRQSQEPAPDEPPAEASELAQAKWEAWRDVRTLTAAEAMDAYAEIIEGLVAMMAAFDDEPGCEPGPSSSGDEMHLAGANGVEGTAYAEEGEEEDEEEEGEGDEDEEDEEEEENEEAPRVTQTVWSTAALNVPAGGTLNVPLAFDSPCRCTYSYAIVSGSGPIAFRITGPEQGASPLLSEYKNDSSGRFEVSVPPALTGGVLSATLDNTASVLTAIEVKCRVCLEPLAELQALENYQSRHALRQLIRRKEATLEAHTRTYAKVGREAQELQSTVSTLKEQLTVAESEIKIKYKQCVRAPRAAPASASRRGASGARGRCERRRCGAPSRRARASLTAGWTRAPRWRRSCRRRSVRARHASCELPSTHPLRPTVSCTRRALEQTSCRSS
jgi:acyl-CoA-binding protein